MSHEIQSRLPEWVSNPLLRVAAGAVALGGSLASCGGDDAGDVDPGFTPDSAHTFTVGSATATNSPIIEVTSTPTATPTIEPIATPTPEKRVQDVPCMILPQEFCNDAEVIMWEYKGQTYNLLAFKLPPGTPIYAPYDGTLNKGTLSGDPTKGKFIIVLKKDAPTDAVSFEGDVINNGTDFNVKSGGVVGTIGDTGITNFGDYNLIVRVNTLGEDKKPKTDQVLLEQLFPGISSVTPSENVVQNSSVRPSIGSPTYSNTPIGK